MTQDDGKRSKSAAFRRVSGIVKFIFVPDTAGYFFWACLFYLATGIMQVTTLPRIAESFCQVRRNGTLCTEDCPDMLLLCPASECFGDAMNLTWYQEANTAKKSYNQAFVGASLNQECLNMMQFATSPVDAVHLIYTRSSDSTLAVNEDCKVLSCRVLANALYLMPDLQNGGANCTNQFEIKTPEDASFCPCSSLLAEIDSTVQAEIDSVCGSRLLKDGCGKYATEPSWCNSTGGRRLDVLETSEAAELPCKTPSWQEPPTLDSFLEVPSESRQLQQVNSDAPPWTVGPWSTCKCFEQCMPGLRSRIVQCGGSVCRGSQPESTQECTCTHCALCQHAEIVLHISLIINFSQAGMALILGLALGYFGSLGEEKLIKISLLSKLAGFFCKNLPMLENLADLVSLGLFVWLVIITYIPPIFELYWMQDCFQNELLRVSCSVPLLLWLCRLMLGRCAKRYTRVPPQLYSPVRRLPMGIKHINAFMRCLGPV